MRPACLALTLAVAAAAPPGILLAQGAWTTLTTLPCPTTTVSARATDLFGVAIFESDNAIWRSDGTAAGTYPLTTRNVLPWSMEPLVRMGDHVYFSNVDAATGEELWRSDGTLAGTVRVRDYLPGPTNLQPRLLTAARGFVIFRGQTPPSSGIEPYVSDGTHHGTRLLADVMPGANGSNPGPFLPLGDRVVFPASDGVHGRELWTTDGTTAGTSLLVDLVPGSGGLSGTMVGSDGTRAYWREGDYSAVRLIATDGTAAGTVTLHAWSQQLRYPDPVRGLATAGGRAHFTVEFYNFPGSNFELWSTDGTPGGTVSHGEIWPVAARTTGSAPRLWSLGTHLLYERETTAAGREPWLLDPATGATWPVADFAPGSASSVVGEAIAMDSGTVLLTVGTPGNFGLWAVDRTGATPPVALHPNAGSLMAVGSRFVWFVGLDGAQGFEAWRSDGTVAGTTRRGGEAVAGANGMLPHTHLVSGGKLFVLGSERIGTQNAYWCGPRIWAVAPGGHGLAIGDAGAWGAGRGTLAGSDPVLGAALQLRLHRLDASTAFVVATDLASTRPTWLGSFWIYSGLAAPQTLAFGSVSQGGGSIQMPVPANPTLAGFELVAQAFGIGGSQVQPTNGILLVLGY